MPKIVINEHDNTSAGISGQYANFTVVVPGPVTEKSNLSKFDANNIRLYTSQKDFKTEVGKIIGDKTLTKGAVAPKPDIMDYTKWKDVPVLDEDDKPVLDAEGKPTTSKEKDGYDTEKFASDIDSGCLYVKTVDLDAVAGEYKDDGYTYIQLTDVDKTKFEEELNDAECYVVLTKDTKGENAVETTHYGNQIAWELLGLGYTVLYKAFAKDNSVKKDWEKKGRILSLVTAINNDEWWACLKDKSEYDFRYIISGLLEGNKDVNTCMRNLASAGDGESGRGDCIALCDLDERSYRGCTQSAAITNMAEALTGFTASPYAAIFAPSVKYQMPTDSDYAVDNISNKTFPASFHYLACAARAAKNYSEWYAIAGYNRGISNYTIDTVSCNFGEDAIEAFSARTKDPEGTIDKAVNLIVKIKNNYYLWGNRTAAALDAQDETGTKGLTAQHFLNIRQLCTTLKKQLYVSCRKFTFEPNSDLLWIEFCNSIKETLDRMKADQGISDYRLIKVKSTKKALLSAKIKIVPIEAVEDFEIDLYLEDALESTTIKEN